MITKMYCVFDSKLAVFTTPFYAINDNGAVRSFSDAVNEDRNPNNLWNKHPEDYQLFFVGDFNDATAEILPSNPKSILTASAVVQLSINNSIKEAVQ